MPHVPTLLVQIGVILVIARLVGWLFRKIHQPQVMGEMVAGILLGPSLLGSLWPTFSATLFPTESLGYLNALSQIGLVLFMFLVGLELNPMLLKGQKHAAVVISHVSIVVPFMLGAMLSLYLYPRLSDDSVPFSHFALFVGTALSITAFPVLARVLTERNLLRTRVGALTIACAAVDDITAWCLLAGVVVLVRAGDVTLPLWVTVVGSLVFATAIWAGARPMLQRLNKRFQEREILSQNMFAFILLLVLASAWMTEWLGIHALFGAFLMGAAMPKESSLVHAITEKLEDVTVVLMLPLFFAFTGLRTSVGLLNSAEMWFYCALIVAVAIAGKFGGSTLAARFSGMEWREAGALGVLMNTRGLMELVVLNIGLDIGILSPALFTMLVLMALITTFMTSPLLEWIYPTRYFWRNQVGAAVERAA